ncbi:hypothetical protein BDN70DRAFT_937065 [Pholiota conissans]|uniref:Uncharacterized protein n=1 Tax=Pholiota conissans TaxID=109636 RepID=A0A9P6CV79_9AGAR|nr:hypothetical protein BDN70DRAFT_937065 [Pholiota conissans]
MEPSAPSTIRGVIDSLRSSVLQNDTATASASQKITASSSSSSSQNAEASSSKGKGKAVEPALPVNEDQLKVLMDMMKMMPPKVSTFFKIPDGIGPRWQDFFQRVTLFFEIDSNSDPDALPALEARKNLMDAQNLSELEMYMNASHFKKQGDAEVDEDIFKAKIWFTRSVMTFPLPHACAAMMFYAYKSNEFALAEKYGTKALRMDLLTDSWSIGQVYYMRAHARYRMGQMQRAKEDIILSKHYDPLNADADALLGEIDKLRDVLRHPELVKAWVREQPQFEPELSVGEEFRKLEEISFIYARFTPEQLERVKTDDEKYCPVF